jgi:hypothetical protein
MRKLFRWIAPAAVACTVLSLSLGVAQASRTASTSPVKVKGVAPAQVTVAAGKLLKSVIVANGFSGATVGAGFQAVDSSHVINCAATKAPCTIEGVMMVQFDSGVSVGAPGPWAICLNVDGNYNTCPFMDAGASNSFYTAATATGYLTGLAAGNHTVRTFLYTSNGTAIYNFDIAYHEYTG